MRLKGFCFWEEYIVTDSPDSEPMGFCRHPNVNGFCVYSGNWETFEFKEDKCPYFIEEEQQNICELIEDNKGV